MRHKLKKSGLVEGKDFIIDSAGTISRWQGSPPDDRSQAVMSKHGIDISNLQARPLTKEDGNEFDVILCMDSNNIADAKQIIDSKNHHKIRLLDSSSIDDPFISVAAGFDKMYSHIDVATNALIDELFS